MKGDFFMGNISLDPYIFFQGNAAEAMEFYKSVFGGKVITQNMDDVPEGVPIDPSMKGKVMHARLEGGEVTLMGSDSQKASDEAKKVELSLSGSEEEKMRKIFDELSKEGKVNMPLEKQFWGDIFGNLTDKYGIVWMVNIAQPKEK
jgi:PhnB protein